MAKFSIAEASFAKLFAGGSATLDVEPTTYEDLIGTSHGLTAEAGSFEGEDISSSRKPPGSFRTNIAGRGDIAHHWRPAVWDPFVESGLAAALAGGDSVTAAMTFGAPDGSDRQLITADAGTPFATWNTGETYRIQDAVDAGNNGVFTIIRKVDDSNIVIYNPDGDAETSDTVTISNTSLAEIGAAKRYIWAERMFNDGTNDIYSEWYKNCLVNSWNMVFPAANPTRVTFNLQGESPVLVHAGGTPPVTKQRGGSDTGPSTDRLVHGMQDVRQLYVSEGDLANPDIYELHELVNSFEFTLENNIRQDSAVGRAEVINTALGRTRLTGRFGAFINDQAFSASKFLELLQTDPDDYQLHCVFGATDATCYGLTFKDIHFNTAQSPVAGNNQAVLMNCAFTATDLVVTKI